MHQPTCELVRELMHDTNPKNPRRVKAIVGLRLLEVVRDRDLPSEILEEEDPAQTIPRRLGLSNAVERQIRAYGDDVRKGVRLTDEGTTALFTLVNRRSDSDEVFFSTGRELVKVRSPFRWGQVLPTSFQYMFARTFFGWYLKHLFGRHIVGLAEGPFNVEAQGLFFRKSDPEGKVCHF
ncbi:MAG TPA: hypothetical protein EYM97_08715, partial [Gemmatimonadetes bacterium]|nr:hypothetical protein [Gemmatimonadota bacterium]